MLRAGVGGFLTAMARGTDEERRAFERIPGNGAIATLSLSNNGPVKAQIQDISLGGISLAHAGHAATGPEGTVVCRRAAWCPPGGWNRMEAPSRGLLPAAFEVARITKALAALGSADAGHGAARPALAA